MLTRVYIDNYLCFVNFEYRPERTQLIFGSNGAGKSSFMDALLALRQFAITGLKVDQIFRHNLRTRWLDRPTQTFELQAELDGRKYQYRLVLDLDSDQSKVRVESEEVNCDEKPIFEFRKVKSDYTMTVSNFCSIIHSILVAQLSKPLAIEKTICCYHDLRLGSEVSIVSGSTPMEWTSVLKGSIFIQT